ncbi:MAG TPA: SDR family NAD(P)-dependent oxidoreductase [Myxococcota bacterium]|nr:SDR family NAD(P)-dependent oxidoreductase [Myxococcota bacterium]HQK49786.1 SDR family NAD(P)-dependent oxidoreductase [Myxococcota bacterium]
MRPEHPVVLVTGASAGIGEAVAWALAREGYRLALGARRADRLRALAGAIQDGTGAEVFAGAMDVRDGASVEDFVDRAANRFGALHVVVNNAGLARGVATVDRVSEEEWSEMLRTNVEGVLRVTQACLPHLRRAGWGHLVFLGSTASHAVYEGGGVYCATKHAVRALTETLRLELCGEPIRVTSVDPGMVETEFSLVRLGSRERADQVYRGMTPLRAEDIAECVRWALAAPDHVNVDRILVRPLDQAAMHKVHRRQD